MLHSATGKGCNKPILWVGLNENSFLTTWWHERRLNGFIEQATTTIQSYVYYYCWPANTVDVSIGFFKTVSVCLIPIKERIFSIAARLCVFFVCCINVLWKLTDPANTGRPVSRSTQRKKRQQQQQLTSLLRANFGLKGKTHQEEPSEAEQRRAGPSYTEAGQALTPGPVDAASPLAPQFTPAWGCSS